MTALLVLSEDQIMKSLGDFLTDILPAGVQVIRGQENRVAEPSSPSFVVMTPIYRERLATNIDVDGDAWFTGSISGAVMTISAVFQGALKVGSPVFGVGVADGTKVIALGTGHGGIGTYTVSPSQTVTSRTLAAGFHNAQTSSRLTVQCTVQGKDSTDNAQIVATMFRDGYAAQFFADTGLEVQPLYVVDPRQTPFINGEDQYEYQWTVDVTLQANPIVSTPQQFADTVTIGLIDVDVVYPPA